VKGRKIEIQKLSVTVM